MPVTLDTLRTGYSIPTVFQIAGTRSRLVMFPVGFRAGSRNETYGAIRGRESASLVLIPAAHPIIQTYDTKVIHVANIKSQIKRIGTNKKAQDRNRAVKSELKTAVRAATKAVAAGDKDAAATALALAGKKLDKAVSKGVIHKNQAANRKSAIAKQVSAL
jgi:small subunit ribosomal protein S20